MKRITLSRLAPFVGLRPFTEDESLLFFGRDAHVRDLLAKLERRQRFTAGLGASGTGKSSLVRAGLIPALHRGALHPRAATEGEPPHLWNVCTVQPGDAPLANLAKALIEDPRWADRAEPDVAESSLAAALGASPLALVDLYRQKSDRFAGESLLLVVDQFEEIFRYRQKNPNEADSFIQLLLRSATEDLPIYVVTTMRSDFLGNCVAFLGLPEAINSGIYLTPRLLPEQIRSVIMSPLALVGGSIDAALANRMANALGDDDELPILQHALLRMWQRVHSMGRTHIDASDFETICKARDGTAGGTESAPRTPMLSYAIDNHASEIYDALTPEQRGVARQFFLALVERRDGREVRRPQTLHDIKRQLAEQQHPALLAVIDAFRADDAGFVLPRSALPIEDYTLIDISHESLFRQWQRFRDWLAEEDQDVAELREWRQRAVSSGLRGGWLDENDCDRAQRWRARVHDRAQPEMWAERYEGPGAYAQIDKYIEASLAWLAEAKAKQEALKRQVEAERTARLEAEAHSEREAAERAENKLRQAEKERAQALAFTAVLRRRSRVAIIVSLVAVALVLVASGFWRQADKQTQRAEAMARKAVAAELATTAESLAKSFPDQSLLLAVAARQVASSSKADAILRVAGDAYPYRQVLRGHEGPVVSARFSADGKTVLTASSDKTARLWDLASGRELQVLRGHGGSVASARFSADGKTVLTASGDKTARLWRCDDCGRPMDAIAREVAQRVGRSLTEDERRRFGIEASQSFRN